MFMTALVQNLWLMRAVTSGLSTGGSLAVALKLLSWADRAEQFALPLGGWHLDYPSLFPGLLVGLLIFLAIEVWCAIKWCLICWFERKELGAGGVKFVQRKPLYKLCLLMSARVQAHLEDEVVELREELDEVRSELRKLRREVRELRGLLSAGSDSRPSARASGTSRRFIHHQQKAIPPISRTFSSPFATL